MANFVLIFSAGFPRIYENAKLPENTCLKDFCILSLFVTWSNTLSENESYYIIALLTFIIFRSASSFIHCWLLPLHHCNLFCGDDDSYCGHMWLKFLFAVTTFQLVTISTSWYLKWRMSLVVEELNIIVTCDLLLIIL